MSGEEPELDCKELLQLVTSLQTLTASQQQVNINNFVSFLPYFHIHIICEGENYTKCFFSSKRRPGRVTCSWFLLTTRSLITSISRSPSPRPSWSLHCPCDSKHFNSTGNLFFSFLWRVLCLKTKVIWCPLSCLECCFYLSPSSQVVGSKNRQRHSQPPLPVSCLSDDVFCFSSVVTKLSWFFTN